MRLTRDAVIVSCLLAAGSLAACEGSGVGARPKQWRGFDHEGLELASLEGRALNEGDFLGLPARVGVVGPHLVVADLAANPSLHLLRASDGRHLASFGRRGSGPGEFQSAANLLGVPGSESVFWVYDFNLGRITRFDLAEPDSSRFRGRNTILLQTAAAYNPVLLADSVVVSLGYFERGRLGEFDRAGKLAREHGPVPPGKEEHPYHIRQHSYYGTLAANPGRTRIAVACNYAGQLEIYEAGGRFVGMAEAPYPFEPRFGTVPGRKGLNFQVVPELRYGYVGVAATDRHILALFSGRTHEPSPRTAGRGEYVHVFDWDGRFVKALRLSSAVSSIAVSPDGSRLYAVRNDPRPGVMEFPLAEALPARAPGGLAERTRTGAGADS
jgi:TolB-like 6-blade propeller-like